MGSGEWGVGSGDRNKHGKRENEKWNPSLISKYISITGLCLGCGLLVLFPFFIVPFLFPARACFPLVTSLSPHGFLKLIARVSNVTRDFFCLSQSEYNISEKQKQSRNHFEKPYLPVEGSSKSKLLKTTSSLLESPLYLADKRHLSEMVDSIAKGSGSLI